MSSQATEVLAITEDKYGWVNHLTGVLFRLPLQRGLSSVLRRPLSFFSVLIHFGTVQFLYFPTNCLILYFSFSDLSVKSTI